MDVVEVILLALDRAGRVTLVNRKGCEVLGLAADGIVGRDWCGSFVPERERHETKALLDRLLGGEIEAGEIHENPVLTASGEERIVAWRNVLLRDGSGRVQGILSSGEDVTGTREIEEKLRTMRENFRTLIDQIPDAVAVHRDGLFVYVNRQMAAGLGYDHPRDLVGRPVIDVIHPEDHALAAEHARHMAETGRAAPLEEMRFVHRDGRELVAELSATPIRFSGSPAILVVARDTTERRELLSRVMQMDRILSVGTLAAGLGHEINNPLTFVTENIRFALERLGGMFPNDEIDEVVEALEEARHGVGRIALVARDLRTFARSDRDLRRVVPVERIIESAISIAWNEIRHRAHFVRDFTPDLYIEANEPRIGQVLLNLLVNAAHAIPEGQADRNEICVRAFPRDRSVVVEVEDTGSGIPEEDRERIFEPFYTTKPPGQGTGLGLSICREVVRSHGGALHVESRPGEGSIFSVVLPMAEPPAAEEAGAPPVVDPTCRRGRILVVDDEAMICNLVSRALGKEHEVITLTDPRKALETIRRCQRFDLIFCDLMMPEMTGMDLYESIRSRSPEDAARMIFLTGGAFTPRATEFIDAVENPRLEKPFDLRRLRRMVAELLGPAKSQ
jgi:PAS domain S-box-containing protein